MVDSQMRFLDHESLIHEEDLSITTPSLLHLLLISIYMNDR